MNKYYQVSFNHKEFNTVFDLIKRELEYAEDSELAALQESLEALRDAEVHEIN